MSNTSPITSILCRQQFRLMMKLWGILAYMYVYKHTHKICTTGLVYHCRPPLRCKWAMKVVSVNFGQFCLMLCRAWCSKTKTSFGQFQFRWVLVSFGTFSSDWDTFYGVLVSFGQFGPEIDWTWPKLEFQSCSVNFGQFRPKFLHH